VAHLAGPAQRGRGLPFGGAQQGVAWINGKSRKEAQSAPVAAQRSVVRQQENQEVFQIVCLGNRKTQFLQQGFQILLGGLEGVNFPPLKSHLVDLRLRCP
jgi:hypothetical protein